MATSQDSDQIMKRVIRGLYAITDNQQADRLLPQVEAALQGGVRLLQYRDKSGDHSRRRAEAAALRILCRCHGVPLLINDDVELALAIDADGVHLGQGDLDLRVARQRLGPDRLIGITCHDSLALAKKAEADGADYVAFGACFPSISKPTARTCPLNLMGEARQQLQLPVVAIGGINPDNIASVIAAGADACAVIASLWQAVDVRARAQALALEFSLS